MCDFKSSNFFHKKRCSHTHTILYTHTHTILYTHTQCIFCGILYVLYFFKYNKTYLNHYILLFTYIYIIFYQLVVWFLLWCERLEADIEDEDELYFVYFVDFLDDDPFAKLFNGK